MAHHTAVNLKQKEVSPWNYADVETSQNIYSFASKRIETIAAAVKFRKLRKK